MKKYYAFLVIIIILAAAWFLLVKKPEKEKLSTEQFEQSLTDHACFLYEADVSVDDLTLINREYIELNTHENMVSGIHNILPADGDSYYSSLIGVTNGDFVNVVATVKGEGKTWQEQRVYKIEGNKLFVGYQPVYVPQYKNDQGVYMYEDINKLVFNTEEFFLEKVDCESVEREKVS